MSQENPIFMEFVRAFMGKSCANFNFPNSRNPLPGDVPPLPSFHVNVSVKYEDGSPTRAFERFKVIENLIGDHESRSNTDGTLRLIMKDRKLKDKIIKTKTITLNDIEYIIEAIPDKKVNQGRGVFRTDDLKDWTIVEIKNELNRKGYNAVDVFPFTRAETIDGVRVEKRVGAYKVTFDSPEVPFELKFAGIKVKVSLFHDNPMFCKRCGVFGHTPKKCTAENPRCLKCGSESHKLEECVNMRCCMSCFKDHDLNPKSCEVYKFEQKCIRYAASEQISVGQARKYATKLIGEFVHEVALQGAQFAIEAAEKGQQYVINYEHFKFPSWYQENQIEPAKPKPMMKRKKFVNNRSYFGMFVEQRDETMYEATNERGGVKVDPRQRVEMLDNQLKDRHESMDDEYYSDDEPAQKKFASQS